MTFKELREQSGMNMKKFAAHFEIPYRTVQNWEAGVNKCPEYLLKLMKFRLYPEKVKAQWISTSDDDQYEDLYFCSACREESYFPDGKAKFCPNCGADMERGGEDAEQ